MKFFPDLPGSIDISLILLPKAFTSYLLYPTSPIISESNLFSIPVFPTLVPVAILFFKYSLFFKSFLLAFDT